MKRFVITEEELSYLTEQEAFEFEATSLGDAALISEADCYYLESLRSYRLRKALTYLICFLSGGITALLLKGF